MVLFSFIMWIASNALFQGFTHPQGSAAGTA
jgi:hypothetical protein